MADDQKIKEDQIKNLLDTYSVKDIISIFSGIDNRIISLHEASSQDFLTLNNLLRKYHGQAKTISEGATHIFNLLSGKENDDIYLDLKNLYKKLNNQATAFNNQFESCGRLMDRTSTLLNLMFVPLNNFKQNLMTLKFLVANIKLNMAYHNITPNSEIDEELQNIDKLISDIKLIYPVLNETLLNVKKEIKDLQARQREIEKGNTSGISDILQQIYSSITMLSDHNEQTSQQMPKLRQRTENYLRSIGQIVTNLQYHDIIRQKMEHIQETHKEIISELNMLEASNNMSLLIARQAKYIAEIPDIAEIQVAQLILTNKEYQSAIDIITKKLIEIDEDLAAISSMGNQLSGSASNMDESGLDKIEQNLKNAVDMVKNLNKVNTNFNDHMIQINQQISNLHPGFLTMAKLNETLDQVVHQKIQQAENNQHPDKEVLILYKQFISLATDINSTTLQLMDLYKQCAEVSIKYPGQYEQNLIFTMDDLPKDIEMIIDTLQNNIDIVQKISAENSELSRIISSDIKSSIQEVKYYDFFEKVIEEIVLELNNIFTKLKSTDGEGIKQKLNNLRAIEEFYTMHSERTIHNKIVSKEEIDMDKIEDSTKLKDDENLELF